MARLLQQIRIHCARLIRGRTFQPGSFVNSRGFLAFGGLALLFVVLSLRAINIQLFPPASQSLNRIADRQYNRELSLSRYRGGIYDHRGDSLAISIRKPSLFINPKLFAPTSEQLQALSKLIKLPDEKIKKAAGKKRYFAWLKRKISPPILEKVRDLKIPGLFDVMEPARFYPAGSAIAHLVGVVGSDDHGLFGIEQQFDTTLRGPPLKIVQSLDAKGNTIFLHAKDARPEESGDHVYLTIDRAIQEFAEDALAQGVLTAKAKGGFVIVADPHTGKILALANNPRFDPAQQSKLNIEKTKNQALMNSFEPGSVMKTFVIATALQKNVINEHSQFDCEGGVLKVGSDFIHDSHPPKKQYLSTEETFIHSSNVCTYKIAQKLGLQRTSEGLKNFGFGERLGNVGYPGEAIGGLSSWQDWLPIRFANIAFGQGLTTTGLELVQALSAIANGGMLYKPLIIDHIENSRKAITYASSSIPVRRVISAETAKRMRQLMTKAVEEGAVRAKLEHYTAAGKTGTAQKIDPLTKGYSHSKHLSTFMGIAPAHDPHIVMYVQIDEPNREQNYGALWAAPVFAQIAQRTLPYLNVAPDKKPAKDTLDIARGEKKLSESIGADKKAPL